MSVVTYNNTQVGTEAAGAWFSTILAVGQLPPAITAISGMQFTVPAPNEILIRSVEIHMTADAFIPAGPTEATGDLTIGMVNDINLQPFSTANLPSGLELVSIYTIPEITFVAGVESVILFDMEPNVSLVSEFTGGFNTAPQVFGHSGFQGVMGLVFSFSGIVTTFTLDPVIVIDQEPFLTGLRTGKQMQSKATFCPRCGTPTFREYLVKDGFTKSLVCTDCWDPPESRGRRAVVPKEINP
jgi:hypothetical protein